MILFCREETSHADNDRNEPLNERIIIGEAPLARLAKVKFANQV